jgi:glycosyltransferase involved in cell wall biosynthesis
MENNKITIVTPSFNQGKFIERTIRSIWDQEGDFCIEHIIADGGSTDGTVEIIKKYEKLLDSGEYPIKCKGIDLIWWSKKDNGQADALNEAFKISTGDILGWLNSDDTYCSNKSLNYIFENFKDKKPDIIAGKAYFINENDEIISDHAYINRIKEGFVESQSFGETLLQYDFIPQPSTFFTKKVYENIGIEPEWFYSMDWVLWIESIRKGFKFFKLNKHIGNLRSQKNAKTVIKGINFYKEKLKVYKRYKVWGLNRIYCHILLFENKIKKTPFAGSFLASMLNKCIKGLGFLKNIFLKNSNPVG